MNPKLPGRSWALRDQGGGAKIAWVPIRPLVSVNTHLMSW